MKAANFDLCIFCQTKTTDKFNLVATIEVSDNVLKAAESDYTVHQAVYAAFS